jgi:hypothetical protein
MPKLTSVLRELRSPPALAVLAALFLASFLMCGSEAMWVGSATIPLEFIVADAATQGPVSGALVKLVDRQPEYIAPVTGQDGRTRLTITATCGGSSSIFRRTRSVNYHCELRVEADDYETFRGDLSDLTRDHRYPDGNAVPPPILIQVHRQARAESHTVRLGRRRVALVARPNAVRNYG